MQKSAPIDCIKYVLDFTKISKIQKIGMTNIELSSAGL